MLVPRYFLTVFVFFVRTSLGYDCPHEAPGLEKWSDEKSWPNNKLPEPHDDVVIDRHILLDKTPPELRSITINPGASLVWSPDGDISSTLRYIHIHGRMDIGSEKCPYEGNAKITLTGKRGEYYIPQFNEKFIGVDVNGTLEIHGRNKLSWTKLSKTLRKLSVGDGIYHEHLQSENARIKYGQEGVAVYSVNTVTKATEYNVFYISGKFDIVAREIRYFKEFINKIPVGNLVFIGVHDKLTRENDFADHSELFNAVEELAYGTVTGNSVLRTLGEKDAYVLLTLKGDPSTTIEKADFSPSAEPYRQAIAEMTLWNRKLKVLAESYVHDTVWRGYVNLYLVDTDRAYPVLDVIDDTGSWEKGDRLLITSTDYDWKQAEIGTVVDCPLCTSKQVRIDLLTKYTHLGEILNAVDMRGEVALLSRNIVIEGRVKTSCPPENENCNKYAYDTFGGHVKAIRGFKNVHIEGAELVHMGQQTDLEGIYPTELEVQDTTGSINAASYLDYNSNLTFKQGKLNLKLYDKRGRYPLHFHMCHDVDNEGYPDPPYLRNNVIHDSFSRCTTIHGTHGVKVIDNVCYKFLGHGYFEEDGGEKRTVFDGNLGVGALEGSLIPTDSSNPSIFWITNPLTYLRNNVAGGGDGVGMWIIFVEQPWGASEGLGFMKPGEAFGTALLEFNNNVMHSNKQTGVILDRKILSDGSLDPKTLHYIPTKDPMNWRTDAVEVKIHKLTAYKNRMNGWMRGGWLHISRASFSDSPTGFIFARGGNKGQQFMTDSVFIGESENLGEPQRIYNRTTRTYRILPRSYGRELNYPWQGFVVYDGPVYADNVWFDKYKHTEDYKMGAIGFLINNKFASSSVSSVSRVMFGFDDGPTTGNRVFDGDETMYKFTNLDGDKGSTVRDEDGSLTSFPGYQIVKPNPYYVTDQCFFRTNWNMAVCPHKYGKLLFKLFSSSELLNALPLMARDDIPEMYETITGQRMIEFAVIIGGTHSYTLHWRKQVPKKVQLQLRGLERGYPVRIGVCVPKGATFELMSYVPVRAPALSNWKQMDSIDELDADTVGGSYFYDAEVRLLFFKFISYNARTNDTSSDCEGYCPYVHITFTGGDINDGDCRDETYPKYLRTSTINDVILPATSTSPPKGLGAGSTKPFETRVKVDGGFGLWSVWGSCSVSCGGGKQKRTRACNNPMPTNGGADCHGNRVEEQDCNTEQCPIEGGFGSWQGWSDCKEVKDCNGYKTRERNCDSPTPEFGGLYCSGFNREVISCKTC